MCAASLYEVAMKFTKNKLVWLLALVVFAFANLSFFTVKPVFAAASPEQKDFQLRLGPGHVLAFQFVKATKENAPTFLLLPGMNRNLLISESGVEALIAKG